MNLKEYTDERCECGAKPLCQQEVFQYESIDGKEITKIVCVGCQMKNHLNL